MEIFGWCSAFFFSITYIPQLIKTRVLKTVDDISPWMWILQAVAYITGLVYGIWLQKSPLIFNYSLGLFYTALWLFMWSKYRTDRINE